MLLILVLIVIAMLSLGAYHFTNLMEAHHEAALITARQAQARMLVDSGAEQVRLFLAQTEEAREQAGGIFDNADRFRAQVVLQNLDPKQRGVFSVVSPRLEMTTTSMEPVRFGLEDESSRLNLNTLLTIDQLLPGSSRQLLLALPGMTEDVADAILDAATSGGPGSATEILVYKVYKDGVKALDLGSSAAQSVILMAIVIALTIVQFRYIERKVQY